MIDLIMPENRMRFASALMEMHHDRKRVFVDRLGWELATPGSWLEVDEFDNDYAVYMLATEIATGRHRGSVRLLPTTVPHMLDKLFADLCVDGVVRAEDTWEISRLVTDPNEARGASVLRVHRLLALALVEFAALNDIRRYTLVAEACRLPALLSVGWDVRPLGLPRRLSGEDIQAFEIVLAPSTLGDMRARFGVPHEVLRVAEPARSAA